MHLKGIFTGANLKRKSEQQLTQWFGKAGTYYYNIVQGIDNRVVNPNRIRKSLGAERTYENDITTKEEMLENINNVAEILIKRIGKAGGAGKSLTLKIKYSDFRQITRSKTLPEVLTNQQIKDIGILLLESIPNIEKGIRLIGLQIANFEQENKDIFLEQLEFEF